MRRRLWRIGVFLAAFLALLAFLPWAFSDALLRGPLVEQIASRTGLITERLGRATIAFLPVPHLTFDHIKIRDKSGSWVVEARSVSGDLRLASLLTGQLELKSLSLRQPDIAIDLDAKPFGQAGAIALALRSPAGTPGAEEADATRLGVLAVNSGKMRLRSAKRHVETIFENIDATIDWPRIGRPAIVEGSATWRNHHGRLEASAASPVALLAGRPSQGTVRLRSDLGDIDADGIFADAPRKVFTGTLRASTDSLRNIARIAGFTIPLPGSLDSASVEGEASLSGGRLWLYDAKTTLDGNAFQGSLAVYTDAGRTAVSGTLASDMLDLDGIVANLPATRTVVGAWSREPLDVAELSRGEVDLRISAAKARLSGLQVEDAALSLLLKSGRLEVSLSDARAYGGSVRMRAVGALARPKLDFKLNVVFSNVDLAAFGAAAYGEPWLAGSATGQLNVQNAGDSPAAIVAGLGGSGAVRIQQGELIGIDVEQALRRLEKRPLLSALDIHSGRTTFDALSASMTLAHGLARVENGLVTGPAARISFAGTSNIADRSLDLQARATQTLADGTPGQDGPSLKLWVGGTWEAPRVEPDAASLIRRSGAAAPLFMPRRESNNWIRGLVGRPTALPWLQ